MFGIAAPRSGVAAARRGAAPPRGLGAGQRLRHPRLELAQPRAVRGMRRQELRRLAARLGQVLPQREAPARVEAGVGGEVEAQEIGLALLLAIEGEEDPDLRSDAKQREELLLLRTGRACELAEPL